MRFIRLAMVLYCIALFAACGGLSRKSGDAASPDAKIADGEESAESAESVEKLEPLVLIPNPYLANPVSVPTNVKNEFSKAQGAIRAKKYRQAINILTGLTETHPTLSGPYVNLGIANWRLNDSEEAENAFRFAIQTNPLNMDAYTQLGVFYREQGKFSEAESIYLQALKVWPHHLDSLLNIGILYDLYMGRLKEALGHFKMAQRVIGNEENRELKGWIVDLERRIKAEQ